MNNDVETNLMDKLKQTLMEKACLTDDISDAASVDHEALKTPN